LPDPPPTLTYSLSLHDALPILALREPAPYFLMLCAAVWITPRHAIERARRRGRESSWTERGNIVTSGPFLLKEFRPNERTVVSRSEEHTSDSSHDQISYAVFCL